MSDINARETRASIRWQLLTSVSAIALLASVCMTDAQAADTDRPTVWIELGGQFEQVGGLGDKFTPPFLLVQPTPGPYLHGSPLSVQDAARFSIGPEASISFQPENSDWIFSASIRYGRADGNKDLRHQTVVHHQPKYIAVLGHPPTNFSQNKGNFADTTSEFGERHAIVDFTVGKDVGLGTSGSTSIFNAGVRIAQFNTASHVDVRARPDMQFYNGFQGNQPPPNYYPVGHFHSFAATGAADRSFHGLGPSVSWKASLPVVGKPDAAEMTVDWGVNGALLFGRQKAKTNHLTAMRYYKKYVARGGYSTGGQVAGTYHRTPPAQNRIRSVMVPNAGGFAGLSLKFPNAKLSIGYRGDFFFGAIDGGIDTAKKETRGFYGPFATISIGIGG